MKERKCSRHVSCLFICLLSLCSCGWVSDDIDDCPYGQWLELSFTHNLLNVDAISLLDDITVFVTDSTGILVDRIETHMDTVAMNHNRIEVTHLPEGKYTFVVWAGIADSSFRVGQKMPDGGMDFDNMCLRFSSDTTQQASDFDALYYGCLPDVHIDANYAIHPLGLMRDDNRILCILQQEGDMGESLDKDDFSVMITAPNRVMDFHNLACDSTLSAYQPYSFEEVLPNDSTGTSNAGFLRFGFHTLRLFVDDGSHLIVTDNRTDITLVDLPLSQYLAQVGALYVNKAYECTPQDYIDRQNLHTFVLYLSNGCDGELLVNKLKINDWVIRLQENVSLD